MEAMVAPAPDILERLRDETAEAHRRLERRLIAERRLDTRDGYCSLLERFYGFHVTWEPLAEDALGSALLDGRKKATLLEQDLIALGHSADRIAQLPHCSGVRPFASEAAAFGSMYVVEGSTLGGAVVSREVRRGLGFTADAGCRYFSSYGRNVGQMWKSFRAALRRRTRADEADELVDAARRTFDLLHSWL